ncbi:MAG: SUMF1/EgtB/PvdO family nonheme iron enzyme, partial [Candidatus Eremiobacterota bacterium]
HVTPTPTATPEEHMAIIEGGEFYMGASDKDEDSLLEEKPLHKVYLNAYKIDIYEVTNSQYCEFLNAKLAETDSSEYKWIDLTGEYCRITGSEGKYTVKPGGYENHPVTCVSWYGAEAYGKWCHKRLPSEAEWERAAKGRTKNIYPWGDTWDPFKCANNTGGDGAVMQVGSFPAGASEDKIMDMAGNLCEWCSDWYSPDYYSLQHGKNPAGPADGIYKSVRGGSWNNSKSSYFRTTCRYSFLPGTTSPFVGFRLVKKHYQQ